MRESLIAVQRTYNDGRDRLVNGLKVRGQHKLPHNIIVSPDSSEHLVINNVPFYQQVQQYICLHYAFEKSQIY